MNTANLQIEGLLIAIASLNDLLVTKGMVDRHEICHALDVAEQTVLGDYRTEDLGETQRDAIAFPIRLLRLANNGASDTEIMPFSELAKMVGQTKGRYNDEQ
ncbi:hypothetical protein ABIB57_003995 [Devosia sp. UYZn731]|uniref:hypothetical protein n=1 Tax=Devosia sp. UYZn731 TaxID=3156345 RepID=UPI003395AFDE